MPRASAAHIKCRHLAVITGGSDQIQCLGRNPPPVVVILQLEPGSTTRSLRSTKVCQSHLSTQNHNVNSRTRHRTPGPVMLIKRDVLGRAAAQNRWPPASSGVNAAFGSLVLRPTGGGSPDPSALCAIEGRGGRHHHLPNLSLSFFFLDQFSPDGHTVCELNGTNVREIASGVFDRGRMSL